MTSEAELPESPRLDHELAESPRQDPEVLAALARPHSELSEKLRRQRERIGDKSRSPADARMPRSRTIAVATKGLVRELRREWETPGRYHRASTAPSQATSPTKLSPWHVGWWGALVGLGDGQEAEDAIPECKEDSECDPDEFNSETPVKQDARNYQDVDETPDKSQLSFPRSGNDMSTAAWSGSGDATPRPNSCSTSRFSSPRVSPRVSPRRSSPGVSTSPLQGDTAPSPGDAREQQRFAAVAAMPFVRRSLGGLPEDKAAAAAAEAAAKAAEVGGRVVPLEPEESKCRVCSWITCQDLMGKQQQAQYAVIIDIPEPTRGPQLEGSGSVSR